MPARWRAFRPICSSGRLLDSPPPLPYVASMPAAPRALLRSTLTALLFLCALGVTGYGFLSGTERLRDFAGYYGAARAIGEGYPAVALYDDAWFQRTLVRYGIDEPTIVMYVNPPPVALFALPLVSLSPPAAKLVWNILSLLALIGGWRLLLPALDARPLEWRSLVLLGGIMASAPMLRTLQLGQVYAMLFLLFSAFTRAYRRDLPLPAAGALATALAVKLYGGLIPLLLIAQRKWRMLGWSIALSAGLTAVCILLFGPDAYRAQWGKIAAMSGAADTASLQLRSVIAPLSRLFVYHPAWNPGAVSHIPLIPVLLPPLLLAAALWHTFRRTAGAPLEAYAAILVLSVLFTPLAADHHYLLLWIPAGVLLFHGKRARPALLAAVLVAAFAWYPSFPPSILHGWGSLLAYVRLYGAIGLWWLLVPRTEPTSRPAG